MDKKFYFNNKPQYLAMKIVRNIFNNNLGTSYNDVITSNLHMKEEIDKWIVVILSKGR